jgi:hypothetical protein
MVESSVAMKISFGNVATFPSVVLLGLLLLIPALARGDEAAEYGQSAKGESALMGMFYDLKQTQQHVAVPITYEQTIDQFLKQDWDESVLNHYYRATKLIYTTQIFIPSIDASKGTEAFGVEKLVQPNWYLIHYKGQVVVPQDGTYRFVGYGDNVMIVGVDEKTVLVGDRADIVLPTFKWTSTGEGSQAYPDANLVDGTWLNLTAGQVIDLDVLIGESSGGESAFFLMIEKKGEHYADDGKGHPVLPIFQVAPYDTPAPKYLQNAPLFSKKFVIWKCLQ